MDKNYINYNFRMMISKLQSVNNKSYFLVSRFAVNEFLAHFEAEETSSVHKERSRSHNLKPDKQSFH